MNVTHVCNVTLVHLLGWHRALPSIAMHQQFRDVAAVTSGPP